MIIITTSILSLFCPLAFAAMDVDTARYKRSVQQNNLHQDWPLHCCKLETKSMRFGDNLPDNYVLAGESIGQKFAYVVDTKFNNSIKFKSEVFDTYPYFTRDNCNQDKTSAQFEILTNPNHCKLSYYRTRYDEEKFPNATGNLFPGGQSYAPAVLGDYFARYRNVTPAFHFGPSTETCILDDPHSARGDKNKERGHEILTIDCLESLFNITDGTLHNVTFPNGTSPSNASNVVHFHRTYKNNSPLEQKQKVGFSIKRTNRIHVSLSESFASTRCDTHSHTFSSTFGFGITAGIGFGFGPLSFNFGASFSSAVSDSITDATQTCTSQGQNKSMSRTQTETMQYTFSDEVTIPANSVTTVSAYTSPFIGAVDYRMTFKLNPRISGSRTARDTIMEGIKFFKLADDVEDGDNGDILVHFDGKLSVDAGYEVTVDVNSVPLNGSSTELDNDVYGHATYNLIPDGTSS